MSNKIYLFLIIFTLFIFVACNNTDEPRIEEPSIVEEEPPANEEPPAADESATETEAGLELEIESYRILHEVQEGDTLFSISQMHNISAEVLQQANNLDTTELQIGQLLRIPPEGSELLQDIQFTITVIDEDDIPSLDHTQTVYIGNPGGTNFLIETETYFIRFACRTISARRRIYNSRLYTSGFRRFQFIR